MDANRKLTIASIISNGFLYGTIINLSGNSYNSIVVNIIIGVCFWIFKLKIIDKKYKYKIALADIVSISIAIFVFLLEFPIIVHSIWLSIMVIIIYKYHHAILRGTFT